MWVSAMSKNDSLSIQISVSDLAVSINGADAIANGLFGVTAYEGGSLLAPDDPTSSRTDSSGAAWLRTWNVRSVGFPVPVNW